MKGWPRIHVTLSVQSLGLVLFYVRFQPSAWHFHMSRHSALIKCLPCLFHSAILWIRHTVFLLWSYICILFMSQESYSHFLYVKMNSPHLYQGFDRSWGCMEVSFWVSLKWMTECRKHLKYLRPAQFTAGVKIHFKRPSHKFTTINSSVNGLYVNPLNHIQKWLHPWNPVAVLHLYCYVKLVMWCPLNAFY